MKAALQNAWDYTLDFIADHPRGLIAFGGGVVVGFLIAI